MRYFLLFFCVTFFIVCCKNPSEQVKNEDKVIKQFTDEVNILVHSSDLQKLGFEHLDSRSFSILFYEKEFYLLNRKDQLVVKYLAGKPVNKYKRNGQGPGEFLNPTNIFMFDIDTISVYDLNKRQILFFDRDLNYLKEENVKLQAANLLKVGSLVYCSGIFDNHVFATLDQDLSVKETFREVPPNNKGNFFRFFQYCGYLLPDKTVAATSRLWFDSLCVVDIIDVSSKEILFKLQWQHPHPPTQSELDGRKNWYSSHLVAKYGKYYVAQNYFDSDARDFGNEQIYDLIIFSNTGKLLCRLEDVEYLIVPSIKNQDDSRIFFVDDDGNLCYWDLEDFVYE